MEILVYGKPIKYISVHLDISRLGLGRSRLGSWPLGHHCLSGTAEREGKNLSKHTCVFSQCWLKTGSFYWVTCTR